MSMSKNYKKEALGGVSRVASYSSKIASCELENALLLESCFWWKGFFIFAISCLWWVGGN